jgi:hypothetical protein
MQFQAANEAELCIGWTADKGTVQELTGDSMSRGGLHICMRTRLVKAQ